MNLLPQPSDFESLQTVLKSNKWLAAVVNAKYNRALVDAKKSCGARVLTPQHDDYIQSAVQTFWGDLVTDQKKWNTVVRTAIRREASAEKKMNEARLTANVLSFGKYHGLTLEDVVKSPEGLNYVIWLMGVKPESDNYNLIAVQEYVNTKMGGFIKLKIAINDKKEESKKKKIAEEKQAILNNLPSEIELRSGEKVKDLPLNYIMQSKKGKAIFQIAGNMRAAVRWTKAINSLALATGQTYLLTGTIGWVSSEWCGFTGFKITYKVAE
jgi:hypothetical protein